MKRTRNEITLKLMRRGWTTAMDSALAGGVLALSQRVGEWASVHHIAKRWTLTAGGARVMAYRIIKPTKRTA